MLPIELVQPGHIILFLDDKTPMPPDSSGCNQVGVVLPNGKVLFFRRNRLREIEVENVAKGAKKLISQREPSLLQKIAEYFDTNKKNYFLFRLGMSAIREGKGEIFKSPNIMPVFDYNLSNDEYEKRWNNFLEILELGDFVFTFNKNSIISRFIARLDKGSWSHCGIYSDNGNILESIASGVTKRKIEVYKERYIHIGCYRFFNESTAAAKKRVQIASSFIGISYNYKGAILLGIKMLLGIRLLKQAPTPNGLIYTGAMYLVDYI